MKTMLFATILLCFANNGIAQKYSLVGAWYWSNSTKEISIFIKKGGIVEMHSGKKGDAILTGNSKLGKYSFADNTLTITWKDDSSESYKVNFIDKDSFVINDFGKKNEKIKRKLIFNRVVDEEVIINFG